MTLAQTIRILEGVAAAQPSVNMIVRNDIFRLNACTAARYGVFGWTQGQHSATVDGSLMRFRFTLVYIDRLTADQGNQVEVQSAGIATLDNIIRTLAEMGAVADEGYTFQTFNQRFLDECAGVFASVTFAVPVGGTCPDEFDPMEILTI